MKKKKSDKNSDSFHISAQNIDCWYSLEPPHRGGSNEYPQSMFLRRNKNNNVYLCKPQLYYIKVGFKGGGAKLYRYVFVIVLRRVSSESQQLSSSLADMTPQRVHNVWPLGGYSSSISIPWLHYVAQRSENKKNIFRFIITCKIRNVPFDKYVKGRLMPFRVFAARLTKAWTIDHPHSASKDWSGWSECFAGQTDMSLREQVISTCTLSHIGMLFSNTTKNSLTFYLFIFFPLPLYNACSFS